MKKKKIGLVAITLLAVLALGACGNKTAKDGNTTSSSGSSDSTESVASKYSSKTSNDGKSIEGGTLKVAVPHDSQIQGLFSWAHSQDAYDQMFLQVMDEQIFTTDDNFMFTNDGIAGVEFDVDGKKATFTIRKDLKWSDGEPITIDDYIYYYEVIGNKDYTGVRYDDSLQRVVGIVDYHDGKSDSISGIKKIDDVTCEISYTEMSPGMQYGDGVLGYMLPKHYLSDVPMADLESSDKIRLNPVTLGPFKVKSVKVGESVEMVANENYYKGKPQLDGIVMTVVPTSTVVDELKAKKYDIGLQMDTDTFDTYKEIDGYTNLGVEELYYSYIGFKFGKQDTETGENIMDEDSKMNDVSLRQAMAYAIDTKQLGEKIFFGLRTPANSVIVPAFESLYDSDIKAYNQDVDKAKKLLDDAGYKDTDGDGIREDKDGKKLTINYMAKDGTTTAQTVADYFIQSWKNVGLKVELVGGRLTEFNSFYQKLLDDEEGIDVYDGAWAVGTNPTPIESYGKYATYNMMRYSSPELTKILDKITSVEAFDEKYNKEAYTEFQELIHDQLPVIPVNYNYRITVVNDRVKDFDVANHLPKDVSNPWYPVSVTSEDLK